MAQQIPSGALVVAPAKDGSGYYFEAKWRSGGKQVKRRLKGHAWVVPVGVPGGKPNGRTVGNYRERKGRVPVGHLGVDDAVVQMRGLIAEYVAQEGQRQQERERVTFRRAAEEWYAERRAVAGWKATTARNYAALLRDEGHAPKRRGRVPRARLMRAFGNQEVQNITTADVRAFLRELDQDSALSARSVNAHRLVLSMIMDHCVTQGWVRTNPVAPVPKRREADAAEIITYTPEQVYAIAAQMGDHEALRALVVTLGFAGLRLGEGLELRWRDVSFERSTIHVQRSYVAGIGVSSPKGRRGRTVPMSDQVAQALARLGQRGFLTGPGDLIFPGLASGMTTRTQRHLDPSTVRVRYCEARDRAMIEDRDMPKLRLHDLRHSFGSLAAAGGIDVKSIQTMMGHASIRTTERYLHAVSRREDAQRLTAAFTTAPTESTEQIASAEIAGL